MRLKKKLIHPESGLKDAFDRMVKSRKESPLETVSDHESEEDIPSVKESVPPPSIPAERVSLPVPPLSEMKKEILKALRQDRHSLAAAMEKSGHWDFQNEILSLSFDSPFESTFIEKESRDIEGIIKDHLGWSLKIRTVINQNEEDPGDEETEEQVELVRNVFRGTIIDRSSK